MKPIPTGRTVAAMAMPVQTMVRETSRLMVAQYDPLPTDHTYAGTARKSVARTPDKVTSLRTVGTVICVIESPFLQDDRLHQHRELR